jgi:UDP-N-acetyl-D-glucosamine dehydrogenase
VLAKDILYDERKERMDLEKKIERCEAVVGVIGQGYVGLPLARAFALKKFPTLGFDIDPNKVAKLNRGESYIKTIPSERVQEVRKLGTYEATADFKRLAECDAIIICVPTPLTKTMDPDMSFIVNSTASVVKTLRKGQLVVLESTTYPGTTDEVVKPMLEETGLKCGKDFFLAFSPEREDPGNKNFNTTTIPKVVGGVS